MTGSRYKKSYRTKSKKSIFRIFKNKYFWIVFLIAFVLFSIIYFFFLSSFFKVKDIQISGNEKILTKDIEEAVRKEIDKKILFVIPKNIFSVDFKKSGENLLDQYLIISKINFKRKLPSTIIVDLEERKPIGVWCKPINQEGLEENVVLVQNSDCFNIDNQGILFEQAREEGLVIKSSKDISLGDKVIEEEYIKAILHIHESIDDYNEVDFKEFFVVSDRLILRTKDNWEIYFDSEKNPLDQIFNLKLVLKEKIPYEQKANLEYIDLRFGNKVYFKYIQESVDIVDEN